MPISWISINSSVYAPGAPVASTAFGGAVVNNLNYLYGNQISSVDADGVPLVINGSFEADAPLTTGANMTGWTYAAGTGGTATVVNTVQNHGSQSIEFTQGSAGGNTCGSLTSNNYMNVSPSVPFLLSWMINLQGGSTPWKVVVLWYNASGGSLTSTVAWDTVVNGSGYVNNTWGVYTVPIFPPASAAYAKLQLLPGYNGAAPPSPQAQIYFDGIKCKPYPNFSNSIAFKMTVNQANILNFPTTTPTIIPDGVYLLYIDGGSFPLFLNVTPGQTLQGVLTVFGGFIVANSYTGNPEFGPITNVAPGGTFYGIVRY